EMKIDLVLQNENWIKPLCCGQGWSSDAKGGVGAHDNGICWANGVQGFREYAICCHGRLRQLAAARAPPWMAAEIRSDIAHWRGKKLRRVDLDRFEAPARGKFCRFRVVKGKLVTCEPRTLELCKGGPGSEPYGQFEAAARASRILLELGLLPRNADFYVSVDLYDQSEQPVPVITKARAVFTPGFLRMPSYELVGPLLDKLRHEVSRTTWSEKEPRLYWRGGMRSFNSCQCGGHIPGRAEWPARWRKFNGSTLLEMAATAPQPGGGRLPLTPRCHCQAHWTNSSTFKRNNRIRLCELSRQFPQLIDAKLAYIPDSYDSIRQRLLDLGYAAEFSQKTEQTKYKYLISTDGSTIDDTRIYWMLSTGSIIFKQITPLLPYGIPGLVPWEHFVPIREDMSDLVEKIRFAQANDDSMKQIALR
ncbi:POGLUT3, partial [Symbiodinium sp. CCMP2456]